MFGEENHLTSAIKNQLVLEFPSMAENVGVARVAVAAFAAQLDFSLDEIEDIKIAVSEAVTNAVVHGYRDRPGLVRVAAMLTSDELVVEVADRGKGIADVKKAQEPTFSTDPERLGLGLSFINSLMDKIELRSTPGQGTLVRMSKKPQQTASTAGKV